ncbi:MAG: DMT family transporter [Deltaproteobacteria bacterium]|nr:DMT family transporter [Deltaproteobacteria bacterium]
MTALVWTASAFQWSVVGQRATAGAINIFRTVVAFAVISLAVAAWTGQLWPSQLAGRDQALLLLSGVVGLALGDAFYFLSLLTVGPRRSLVLCLAAAPMTALLGLPALGERLAWSGWVGTLATMVGIALVQFEQGERETVAGLTPRRLWVGTAAGLLAAVAQAISSVLTKRVLVRGVSPLQVTQVRLGAASLSLLAVAAALGKLTTWSRPFAERRVLGHALSAVLLGAVIGLVLMTYSQGLIPVGLSNALTSTSPLFALPVAALVRGDRITPRALAGTALAFAGVALIFLK